MSDEDLECGDLSPLFPLWRLVAKAGPRSATRGRKPDAPLGFDGDKSPAESADESAHSKPGGGGANRVRKRMEDGVRAGFQTRVPIGFERRADLEVSDTAGLETCAPLALPRNV
jgi:hypothetical protein